MNNEIELLWEYIPKMLSYNPFESENWIEYPQDWTGVLMSIKSEFMKGDGELYYFSESEESFGYQKILKESAYKVLCSNYLKNISSLIKLESNRDYKVVSSLLILDLGYRGKNIRPVF